MVRYFVFSIYAVFIFAFSLEGQAFLSLDDALAIGLKQNTGILIAHGNEEISSKQKWLGIAGYLPSLNVSGSASIDNINLETNSPFSLGTQDRTAYNGQIALSWTLFDGLFMFYNDEKYGQLSDLGKVQLRKTIEDQTLAIINSYFDVVRKSELLKIAREGEQISKVRLQQEKVRNDIGSVSSTDFLSAQVTYNNDRLNVLRNENQLQNSMRSLNILLGREPGFSFKVDSTIKVQEMTYDEADMISRGMNRNASVLIQKYQTDISNIDARSSYTNYYPKLMLNGSYSISNSETDSETRGLINQDQTDIQAGLSLNWNLFNGFRDVTNNQTAVIREHNAEYQLMETRRQIESQIRNQVETYQNTIDAYKIQKETVNIAKRNLTLFEGKYNLGSASFIEYRMALLDYLQSKSNLIDAAFLARVAETELKRLTGMLME